MQTLCQSKYSEIGFRAKWPLWIAYQLQSLRDASVKKHVVSTLQEWGNHLVSREIQIQFKLISLNAQTASSLHESQTTFSCAVIAVFKITLKRTATNESLKSTMQSKLENLKNAVAEGEEV